MSLQHRAVTAGLREHPLAERDDQSTLLGEGNELERRDHSLGRMTPAEQRLVPRDLVRLEVDHGLVVERELTGLDRLAELDHPPRTLDGRDIQIGVEERVADVLLALGPVHRGIRLLQHHRRLAADGDPDARCDRELAALELDRSADRLEQTLGHLDGFRRLGDRRDHDRELVSTETRSTVACAQRALQPLAERRKHVVADVVPPAVVDVLEVVEVDEQQCALLSRLLPDRDGVLELLVEERAIRETGKRRRTAPAAATAPAPRAPP